MFVLRLYIISTGNSQMEKLPELKIIVSSLLVRPPSSYGRISVYLMVS